MKNDLIYYSARVLLFLIARLPYAAVPPLGRLFGTLVFALAARERRKTFQGLRTAYPSGLDPGQVERLALATWRNIGRNLFEIIHWTRWPGAKLDTQVAGARGLENLDRALARAKGAFIVTAHLGNWELLAGYLCHRYKGSGVAQKLYDPRFDRLVTDFRLQKLGVAAMIKRGMALRGILAALGDNQIIFSLCDQDTGKDGVFVPFFGKQAWTQSGVARIARKTGAALVPAFMVRGADGRFELHVEKEIEVPQTSDKEKDVVETVQRYTELIEAYVRAYPDQWVWMHERWKTRPPEEAGGPQAGERGGGVERPG